MGTYFDNYITITGTPKAVNSAAESLKQFMHDFYGGSDWDDACDAIHCNIDTTTKPAGKGTVALSCYAAGPRLDITEWIPDFGPHRRGKVIADTICEHDCIRIALRKGSVQQIDAFGAEVDCAYFDLWCRAQSDPDGNAVWDTLLSGLSEPDLRENFLCGTADEATNFAEIALHILAIARLVARGFFPSDQKKVDALYDVVATMPAFIDEIEETGCEQFCDEDEEILSVAIAWVEEQLLRIATPGKEHHGTTAPAGSMRI